MAKAPRFLDPVGRSSGSLAWFVLLPVFVLLAWIYLPVTRGDFVADDYVFLVTGRMVDAPLAAFWQSHFYEPYYFRPIGVLSWWLAERLFGLDYSAHSAINWLLQCLNAALLFWLLRALALRASAVAAGVVLFALGPFALATMLWPSNRFDLLAVGFLLAQAIAMLRALQGNVFAFPLAMLATLGACWSKESAFGVSTVMCFVALGAKGAPLRRRGALFALLGGVIGAAFFWRHRLVSDAYAIASADPIAQVVDGAQAMASALPRLTELIVGASVAPWVGWALLGAALLALIWARRDGGVSLGLIGGALLVLVSAIVVQTPLAKAFAPMLDGGPFGTITFARFYYAPWAALSVVVALVLARGRLGDLSAVTLVGVMVVAGLGARPLADLFVDWTRNEIRPMSVAATQLVDAANDAPCVYVLLGTQTKQPFFRMFSDVTVKARTVLPERTWRCQVMTESTPWLFAFPAGGTAVAPVDLPLHVIAGADGRAKPDSIWSSIRYRYRLPSKELNKLPSARFFEWRDARFVDVTEEVRSGARKIVSTDW